MPQSFLRHDWTADEVSELFKLPFMDLVYKAQSVHRENFDPNHIQISTLLSIKTGRCSEDCGYCSQSAHHKTELEPESLLSTEEVIHAARKAKEAGADRFCMGAAWARPNKRDFPKVLEMVREVKAMGMESCVTLGMLNEEQAGQLREAGLDYYNHNLDTSPEFYGNVITTRTYQDRLDTLKYVQDAGIHVCSGGILGMGESQQDRESLLLQLANLEPHPDSVPVNMLVQVEGTPLFGADELDIFEFIRTIAVARIMMPKSVVRLSAGRETMNEQAQALCFLAGANSIFYGERLLTTGNNAMDEDRKLLRKLGLNAENLTAEDCDHSNSDHDTAMESKANGRATPIRQGNAVSQN